MSLATNPGVHLYIGVLQVGSQQEPRVSLTSPNTIHPSCKQTGVRAEPRQVSRDLNVAIDHR